MIFQRFAAPVRLSGPCCIAFCVLACAAPAKSTFANSLNPPALVASVGSNLVKSIGRYFGKEGTSEASEYLAQKGSKELMERVAMNASREGGQEAVDQIAKLASKYGPKTLEALDNSPILLPVLKALDEIPPSQVSQALTKIAAGQSGKELAEVVGRYGAIAIRSELKHPGVGMVLVRSLGDDGAELAARLTSDQAMIIGRHADDLSKLPLAQRESILGMLSNQTRSMTSFIGRFVEANPGKSLFTVAATTVILAEPERILGGDEIVFDAEGNPIVVTKSGIVGRTIESTGEAAGHISANYLQPLYYAAMVFLGIFTALWMMIKLWHVHLREKAKSDPISAGPGNLPDPADD